MFEYCELCRVIYTVMDDVLSCPICKNKLRNVKLTAKHLHGVGKTANYIERTCAQGMNHSVQFFADETTKQIDLIKISLSPKYSKYLEIDYVNQKCRIHCMKDGKAKYIDIEKMIEPDFPDLIKLKEKISLYITFS